MKVIAMKSLNKKKSARSAGSSSSLGEIEVPEAIVEKKSGKQLCEDWAEKMQDGIVEARPTKASQWVIDELRRIDKSEGSTRHEDNWRSEKNHKHKNKIALALITDKKNTLIKTK